MSEPILIGFLTLLALLIVREWFLYFRSVRRASERLREGR